MRRWTPWMLALAVLAAGAVRVAAEEAWEAEARRAEAEEDRLLDEAQQRGTMRALVNRYASRVSRQPSALNHYLLGRALYYDGDVEGAERQLRRALTLQPSFYFAHKRLAILEVKRNRPQLAERHLDEVLRRSPRDPDALKVLAQIRLEARDWDRALPVLETLLAVEPTNEGVRRSIALVLVQKEDWPRALKELRVLRGRMPQDPAIRWYYATALFQTHDLKEAGREFEALVRIEPKDIRSLDILRLIYLQQSDWKSLQRTLERMLPLVQDEEMAAQIANALARLKAGERPGEAGAGQEWPSNSWMALIDRATGADVEARREALQEYHARQLPRMPHVLVTRIHPDREPDPRCRQWLLRIMGQMQNPLLAQVTAYALYDPDPTVRATAAETLGQVATPSGLLYLMPMLLGDPGHAPTESQLAEINAARRAVIQITGHYDAFGGPDAWVKAEDAARMRAAWIEWLAAPEGVHHRLRAIADLEAQADLRPELHLLEDVSDPDLGIAKAAYGVLLARSKLPSDDEVAAAMWPRFPVFPESEQTLEGFGRIRAAVNAWWEQWRRLRAREQERKRADASGDGR